MRQVFSAIFSNEKVVMTRAQPLQDDLYEYATKLHTYKKKYRYYWTQNNEWLKLTRRDGTKIRREMKIKNYGGCLWCRDAEMVDAEDHYKNKII